MTEHLQTTILASIPGFLTGLATLISSLRNAKTLNENTVKIVEIHMATNGFNKALLKATAAASHAEGMKEQRAEDRHKKPNP